MIAIRRIARRSARGAVIAALATMTVARSQVLVAVPATAEETKPTKPVPALRAEPAPEATPEVATGDFSDPPGSMSPSATGRSTFDPAKSTLVDADTTPTQRVFLNEDGSHTADLSPVPVRFKDPAGQRTEMDMTLVPGADGVLEAKASPAGVRLGSRADGVLATVETEAGPIVLHHPDAAAVGVSVHKDRATYSEALGKGRLDDQIATLGYELDVRRQGIDGIPAQPPQLHQQPRSLGRATPGLERTIELGFGLEL